MGWWLGFIISSLTKIFTSSSLRSVYGTVLNLILKISFSLLPPLSSCRVCWLTIVDIHPKTWTCWEKINQFIDGFIFKLFTWHLSKFSDCQPILLQTRGCSLTQFPKQPPHPSAPPSFNTTFLPLPILADNFALFTYEKYEAIRENSLCLHGYIHQPSCISACCAFSPISCDDGSISAPFWMHTYI